CRSSGVSHALPRYGNQSDAPNGGGGGGLNATATGRVWISGSSTFSGNSAAYGGGGPDNSGAATLNTSTFSGNSAEGYGGGVYNELVVRLANVTVSNNSALAGGALYMSSGYTTVLTNTILAASRAGGNCAGAASAATYSISS